MQGGAMRHSLRLISLQKGNEGELVLCQASIKAAKYGLAGRFTSHSVGSDWEQAADLARWPACAFDPSEANWSVMSLSGDRTST